MSYKSDFMKCEDCGHTFRTILRENQTCVKCPKCKSENTDFDIERELAEMERLASR